jgi:putative isomerase
LDCAAPSGCVHRTELPHKSREAEPAKPVIAQFALRIMDALEATGPEWAERHQVFSRVHRFTQYLEREYVGLHGLFLTHSSLQSGFDSDVLSAGFPDKTVEGPDTNALMVLEYRSLASMARRLGKAALASEFEEKAERLRELMEQLLWFEDETGGRYTALRWSHGAASLDAERVGAQLPDGRIAPFESWVSFLPLYAGIPTPARAERMCQKLLEPLTYWGPQGVRTVPASDVYFHQAPRILLFDFKKNGRGPVSNWSGPVWVLSNFYLMRGLLRYGRRAQARELALKTASLLANGLRSQGTLHECYDDRGVGLWPQAGTFISWSVLALTMLRDIAEPVQK